MDLTNKLIAAAREGDIKLVKKLVSQGADPTNISALTMAVSGKYLNIVKYLVYKGADVTEQGNCAFKWATVNDDLPMVKFLLSKGADINQYDNFALSECIKQNKPTDVVKYLQSKGVKFRGY